MLDNQGKARLLGIPFGTANGRLRKALLFAFAAQLKLLDCYRCGREICSIEEFSIEHMRAWAYADNPVEAFFDLANIAFSHARCNSAAAEHPHRKYADRKEQKREGFKRHYDDPIKRERFLRSKRERYAKNKTIGEII